MTEVEKHTKTYGRGKFKIFPFFQVKRATRSKGDL